MKRKGIAAEREILHKFWQNGWACIRVAGSGSSCYPSPDLLAGNKIKKVAIECKVINDTKKYFPLEEVEQLKKFSEMFGAQPWVAVKFSNKEWYFLTLEDLEETKSQFVVSIKTAELRGLLFEEFIDLMK